MRLMLISPRSMCALVFMFLDRLCALDFDFPRLILVFQDWLHALDVNFSEIDVCADFDFPRLILCA